MQSLADIDDFFDAEAERAQRLRDSRHRLLRDPEGRAVFFPFVSFGPGFAIDDVDEFVDTAWHKSMWPTIFKAGPYALVCTVVILYLPASKLGSSLPVYLWYPIYLLTDMASALYAGSRYPRSAMRSSLSAVLLQEAQCANTTPVANSRKTTVAWVLSVATPLVLLLTRGHAFGFLLVAGLHPLSLWWYYKLGNQSRVLAGIEPAILVPPALVVALLSGMAAAYLGGMALLAPSWPLIFGG